MKHFRAEHEGVRYTCEVCGHEFKTRKNLKRHIENTNVECTRKIIS